MYLRNLLVLSLLFSSLFFFILSSNVNASSEIKNITSTDINLSINAKHAIILDRNSSTILFGKNEYERCKMASTTKIMTAIIVIENCSNLNEIVTVSSNASNTYGSRLGLSTNDKITVENLLYGLMMVSGNDAAICLAEFIAGNVSNFISMMNEKALSLNLNNTHFESPHGLDSDNHYTTAYELSLLSNYALKNVTFSKIVNTTDYTININSNSKNLHNTNELLGVLNGVYGIKTGFTNGANRCLVTACKRGNIDIICVVLGCETKKNRTLDSINLINYIFDNFSTINLKQEISSKFEYWKSNNSSNFIINKAISSNINFYINYDELPYEQITLENYKLNLINLTISCKNELDAPIFPNSKIGYVKCFIENECYFSINVYNSNFVARKNALMYLDDFLKNFSYYFETNLYIL